MAHGRDKYQSRVNRTRLRQILLRDWDPIGVQHAPEASDEYDAYADRAYVMLMDEGRRLKNLPPISIISPPNTWD
jgi:hypothetical protein